MVGKEIGRGRVVGVDDVMRGVTMERVFEELKGYEEKKEGKVICRGCMDGECRRIFRVGGEGGIVGNEKFGGG